MFFNDGLMIPDAGELIVLLLSDLSAAFDTVDRDWLAGTMGRAFQGSPIVDVALL